MNDSFIHTPDLPAADAQANATAGTVTDADSKHVYRNYKARVFELLFSDPANALQLYNCINGTSYTDPGMLEINTLVNAIYLGMRNDVSFVIDSMMSLYEHQSTFNPNLPLRFLFYITDEYAQMTRNDNMYGEKLIRIPAPQFVIFYNGTDKHPDVQELRLSDLYYNHTPEVGLELKATMLNINKGHNKELMEKCQVLKDYAEFTALVRQYLKILPRDQAVKRAVDECISKGILGDFLLKNKEEVYHMCIYEYDEEKHMRQEREYYLEKGKAEEKVDSRASTLLNILGLRGQVPDTLKERILAVKDSELLDRWILIAAQVGTIAEFEEKIRE